MHPDLGSLHMPTTPLKYVKPHRKLVVPYTSHRQIVDLWGKWARKSSVILIVVGWVLDNEAIFIVLTSRNQVSPTSYNAFLYLQKNSSTLTDLGVEIEYVIHLKSLSMV